MNMQTRAMGGFRALNNDEIMAVSGGESIPSGISEGEIQLRIALQTLSPIARQDTLAALVAGGAFGSSFGDDIPPAEAGTPTGSYYNSNSNEIVVYAPAIKDYDLSFGGTFFARLTGDGHYIQYQASITNYGIWGLGYDWYQVGYGTYQFSFTGGEFSVSAPLGVSYSFGGINYTFQPQGR